MIVSQEFPNDPTIIRVESESRPGQNHIVELMNFNGFGECTCEHFEFTIGPGLRSGFAEEPCKHIKEAKIFFATAILERMVHNMLAEASSAR